MAGVNKEVVAGAVEDSNQVVVVEAAVVPATPFGIQASHN